MSLCGSSINLKWHEGLSIVQQVLQLRMQLLLSISLKPRSDMCCLRLKYGAYAVPTCMLFSVKSRIEVMISSGGDVNPFSDHSIDGE
jgi:hypothetical protein